MAKTQMAMDAQFWDLNLATSLKLDGCARAVPGEPFPLDGSRASRLHRLKQLALLRYGFPFGLIPALSPVPSHKEIDSLALQCFPLRISMGDWWLGLVGQIRPKKLIYDFVSQLTSAREWDVSTFQNLAKLFDKSIYSSALFSEIPVTGSSALSEHDISLEAAWPELFIDSKGRYWNVPESVSLDLASLDLGSGFRYRFGIHKNSGNPQAVKTTVLDAPPPSLMPGFCAKAAFSYEKIREFWRQKETIDDIVNKTDEGTYRQFTYDERLKEPHATLSSIIGGTFGAWFQGNSDPESGARIRSPVFADLFGSLCYTFQHGKFRKSYGDLTRLDARLDVFSASALANTMLNILTNSSVTTHENPRLSIILQQQVAGPLVFRVDAKCGIQTPSNGLVKVEDFICCLNYSLRILGSGKVVAWYSPKRKEGMIELRLYEF
ncbi:hypothetical protein V2J09_007451 [Rumex salicifolius]